MVRALRPSVDWYEVGRFLGPNIDDFYARHPLDRIVSLWRQAGIDDVEVGHMSLGGGLVMSGVKRDVRPAA